LRRPPAAFGLILTVRWCYCHSDCCLQEGAGVFLHNQHHHMHGAGYISPRMGVCSLSFFRFAFYQHALCCAFPHAQQVPDADSPGGLQLSCIQTISAPVRCASALAVTIVSHSGRIGNSDVGFLCNVLAVQYSCGDVALVIDSSSVRWELLCTMQCDERSSSRVNTLLTNPFSRPVTVTA